MIKNRFVKIKLSSGFKKYFSNTSWLFFERVISLGTTFFVGIYVARYLGPANFGLYSYAGSFVGLFSAIAALGLDSIVVRELVLDEKKRDTILGTAFILKITGSVFVLIFIFIAIRFTNNDYMTNLLILIIAIGTIFKSFNVIEYYFQSKVLSKYIVYAQIFSTIFCAFIKLYLIYLNMDLIYFALVILFQNIMLASGFVMIYLKRNLSLIKWRLEFDLAKRLLNDSWPLIFSGIAISIYMKIDQVMIKNMVDAKAVGNYAVAVRLTEVWYFFPMIITNSLFPAIVNAKKINIKSYYNRLQTLYDLLVWLAIMISIPMSLLANNVIHFLFGTEYQSAAGVLKIYIWATVFVFLGVASSKYLIVENFTGISFSRNMFGAIINILFNIILIPIFGINGAAIATVFSQFVSAFSIILTPKTYQNGILMLNSFLLIKAIKRVKKIY